MTCTHQGCTNPVRCKGLCITHYESYRRKLIAYGRWEAYVDAQPVREHVLALREAGVGKRRMIELSGVGRNVVARLCSGRPDRPVKRVTRETADKLMSIPLPQIPWSVCADGAQIPAVGSIRRMRALVAAGYTVQFLAARLTGWETDVYRLIREDQKLITAARARRIAELFSALQLQPGSSDYARQYAATKGWALPLEWDEDTIDDPATEPVRAAWTAASARAERVERVAELTARGLTAEEIADIVGVTSRTVERDRAVAS
ncbi:hypothetical protein P3H15_27430 [Rhodococcus sp. T2V]|uniref:hypothetical protein n=1 Tax=Rhodococcus sp. T2V TaxID=3034164 RepID=UPI0023E264B4|nr:hypothetical protein [Rhodococcus sp. T2V]MDF3308755.1 hypothetical protein [Rhodococcus sp. T2V]